MTVPVANGVAVDLTARQVHLARARGRGLPRVLALAGVAAVCAVAAIVTRTPIFRLRDVRVTGNVHVSTAAVRRLGGLGPSTNVLWLSTAAVERGVEREPWIASATVERSLPGTVTIVIRERRPVAVADPGRWLVAADGVVLAKASRGTRLPRIEPGIAIRPNARMAPTRMQLAVARTLARALRPLVRAVRTRPGGHVELVLSGGGVAVLGTMADLARKEAALFQVLRWAHRRTVAVKTVDVRIWTAPTLVLDHG